MDQTKNQDDILKKKLKFNFDKEENDEFSEFDFKPINRGLGFHNEQKRVTPVIKKKEAYSPAISKKIPLDRSHDSLANFYKKSVDVKQEISTQSLGAIYNNKKVESKKLNIKPRIVEAQLHLCFFAWLIDVAIITLAFILISIGFVVFSGIDFSTLKKLVTPNELLIFGAFIYSIFYIMYFSILDLVSTPGNALFGLKLLKLNNEEVRVPQTFLRACLTYFTLLSGFILYFLNFQSKLSETKLVQS